MILEFFSTRKLLNLPRAWRRTSPSAIRPRSPTIRPDGVAETPFRHTRGSLCPGCRVQREHKLGWYKKAKLGNEFKWELKEIGYDEKFIDVATEGLIVYVTRPSSPKT